MRSSAARGGVALLGGDAVAQILRIAAGAIVAARIGPSAFAVWAILQVFIAAGAALDDGGLQSSLVARNSWLRREASAVFWVSALSGVLLCAALPLTGRGIGGHGSEIWPYLMVFGFSFFTSTFAVVPRADLGRDLHFGTIVRIELSARTLGALVTIILVLSWPTVWALLLGALAQRLAEHALLYRARPFLGDWPPHVSEFRSFLRFTGGAVGTNLLGFASTQLGTILVAALLAPDELGVWGLAVAVFVTAQSRIAAALSNVAFPIFVKVPPERRGDAFIQALGIVAALVIPVVLLLTVLTPFVVKGLLGEEWSLLSAVAISLVPAGIARAIGPLTNAALYAQQQTHATLIWELIRLPATLIFTVLGIRWAGGVVGAGWASAPTLVLGLLVTLALLRRHLDIPWSRWALAWGAPLMAASAAALLTYWSVNTSGMPPAPAALTATVGFSGLYLIGMLCLARQLTGEAIKTIASIVRRAA